MRQIVLDTETTGLEVNKGHRLIEIGCIELAERRPTGRSFHRYLNPDRAIDEGAKAVTGIADEFLLDKPRFHEIAEEFIAFVDGAEVIAHNASFDVGFINAELAMAGVAGPFEQRVTVVDTLQLAREMWPGQRNGLDALCKRLGIDNSHRELHGALLDAQLLADVYLAMTSGQGDLSFVSEATPAGLIRRERTLVAMPLRVQLADAEEAAAHEARLQAIEKAGKQPSLWVQLGWS